MAEGIKTVIYPVNDVDAAKARFTALLGVEPYADTPYYVGYKVGETDIGLDPNAHRDGAVVYYAVADIKASVQTLLDAGAQISEDVKDVGQGRLIASVKDADGNLLGLLQDPQ